MDLATAQAFIANSSIQRYVNRIDADAQAALDEMSTNASALSMLPSSFRTEYRRDATALERAWDDFNEQWMRIDRGQARNGRAAMNAYSRYVLTLGVLEQQNNRFGAYVRARAFLLLSTLSTAYLRHAKRVRKHMLRDLAFLNSLDRELQRARRELRGAEAQRAINAAISAVSLCITVSTLGAGLAIAAGIMAVQTAVDAALGPSGPSLSGAAVNATGDLVGLPGAMRPGLARFGGATTGIISFAMDTDEVALAESNISTIRTMMEQYNRAAPGLQRMLVAAARDVTLAQEIYEGAVRQARTQARNFRSHESQRRGLLRELSRLR